MKEITLEYNGYKCAGIEIAAHKIDDFIKDKNETFIICDVEFWSDALETPCNNGDTEAMFLDNSIFYYCDSGFIASRPTEEQVIEYFKKRGLFNTN